MTRKILVTGGAGYIGAHVCKALAGAGYTPVTIDDLAHGHRDAVRWGPLIAADLADRDALAAAFATHSPSAVIHLAGFIEVGESTRDPLRFFRNNVANAIGLLEAMRTAVVGAIVFSSTAAVYGAPQSDLIDERHPTAPVSPYGETKLMVERILAWSGVAHGLGWRALRYFNAAGADPAGEIGEDHSPETHLVPRACLAALGKGPPLDIFGADYPTRDGTAIRDYVHVSDLAAAHVSALDRLMAGSASGPLNLGTGRGHTVAEVIGAVEKAAGRPVPKRVSPRRQGDAPALVANPAEARRELGWTPMIPALDAIVETAWRWHLRRHGGER